MAQAVTQQFSDRIGGIDSQLLAAREVEQAKRQKRQGEEEGTATTASFSAAESGPVARYVSGSARGAQKSVREQAQQRARILQKTAAKKGTAAAVNMGSRWALRASWLSATTVVGFVIGLFYINVHIFLRWVLGEEYFCKLGDEWGGAELKKMTGGAGAFASRGLGLVEVMGILIVDAIVISALLMLVTFIVLIVTLLGNGFVGAIWGAVKGIFTLGFYALSGLILLFGGGS